MATLSLTQAAGWVLYVKPTDVPGTRYVAVRGVSPRATVDDFYTQWQKQEKLATRASRAHLFHVARSAPGQLPSAEQEAEAVPLANPAQQLMNTDLQSGSWLLVRFDASEGARVSRHALALALADALDEPLPGARATAPEHVAPEARAPGAAYASSDDLWQVGRLLPHAGLTQLSPAAMAFAAALQAPRAERPTALVALEHPWLVMP